MGADRPWPAREHRSRVDLGLIGRGDNPTKAPRPQISPTTRCVIVDVGRNGRSARVPPQLVRQSVRHGSISSTREALPGLPERASDLGFFVGGGGRI